MADISKIELPNGSQYNFKDDTSGYITGMTILSYGYSTYADALAAYQANRIVYCKASSNSNPKTGNQLRMAFLAYVNNQTTPTEFEFQYYRSVATHSDTQQGDQVYVYKLNSSGTWSVTVREAYTKIVKGTGLDSSYSNGALTLDHSNSVTAQTTSGLYPIKIDAQGHISEYGTAIDLSTYATLASPALTGTPTAPTATSGDSSTQIATTAFVQNAMSAAGAGTVTSVGVDNATDGGLSVSDSPITSSGTISIGHSNVLTAAQTTQAVYPIAIDKNGHISSYGSAVTIPTALDFFQ